MQQSPLLTANSTILWLKVVLTVVLLVLLYLRYRRGRSAEGGFGAASLATKLLVVVVVLFSFGVFHNLGAFRGGTFVHYSEMFHYYVGSKYFEELGYHDLYDAVLAADAEQGSELAALPFYTDLRTYENASRESGLRNAHRVRGRFSSERWSAFKADIAFFKRATALPDAPPGLLLFLMDHGYNGSPVSTLVLGTISNAVPVTQLQSLALLDVLLVVAMGLLVFRIFGFEMGALFCVYFCVNVLNDQGHVSGSLLRYDWLFYIVLAVCLLERGRHAWSAVFLTLAAMMRVFPALLFLGIAILMLRDLKTTRTVDRRLVRFSAAAAVTGVALFFLPAISLGNVVQPWTDFAANTELHDRGVYVNHLGLRGIVLFEPSHLSLEGFVEANRSGRTDDIVRNWQERKERELRQRRPVILFASLLVLLCLGAVIWRDRADESGAIVWPLLLVYAASYPAHYYYAFLCLLVLLFFKRPNSRRAFVPLCSLLLLNLGVLVTDSFGPSPIVLYTLVNVYLFVCLSTVLGFELFADVMGARPLGEAAGAPPPSQPRRETGRRQRPRKGRGRRK